MKYFCFIALLFLASAGTAQTCTLKLTGHVEDADTKEKLQGATVTVLQNGRSIITDTKGNFVFEGLCEGNYTVIITHISCDTAYKMILLNKDTHIDILLPHTRKLLGSLTVDAQKTMANTGFKKELSGKALEETKGLSLAESLSKLNGVTLLQTGSTISKPVIHGLHSNRILTVNNGVRQEGQQWGNEHAPEIDPFIADKLVVIKGVDELRYGSDAIGGVILVEPRALRTVPGYSAEFNSVYFTNNRQYVFSGMFEQQLKKMPSFRYRVQGTYKRGANSTTPRYRLNNTGSEEKNFSVTAGFKKAQFATELFYSHFATTVGIFNGSHIGNITDLLQAIGAVQPDPVFLGQQTYTVQRPKQEVVHDLVKSKTVLYRGAHKFSLLAAAQFNHRKEFDIIRSSTNKSAQLDLSVYTFTQELSWEHRSKNNFNSHAGLSLMQQDNTYSGRYFIPNYFAYTFGGYYIGKWSRHQWELQGGIRYDNKSIRTTRLKINRDTINYNFNFSTLAASVNAVYKPGDAWRLNTGISLASRAPFVNELLSDGIHHGTATYEKGDIGLQPEQSVNLSAGVNIKNPADIVELDLLLYSNRIRNFIYQQPMPATPVLTIAGAFPLMQYQQTNAVLSGIDLSASVKPVKAINWTTKFSYLHARKTTQNDWLILMPANRLGNEVTVSFNDSKKISRMYVSTELQHVMQQKNVPGNGKQDYKDPPAAYTLLHVNASATVTVSKIPVTLAAGVRNLLNTVYRDYLNAMRYFIDETGRNISLRLTMQL